jgi:hypothetical protein
MKYNKRFSGGNFEDYIKYLNSIKDYIPIELYDFVINPERHNLHEKPPPSSPWAAVDRFWNSAPKGAHGFERSSCTLVGKDGLQNE